MRRDDPLSRRMMVGLTLTGGLIGAGWATGLGVLARGVHPQAFVIGKDDWQIALLEHGSARVVLLLGKVDSEPDEHIEFLCTSFRQHIDAIIGDEMSLGSIDWSRRKWSRAARIVVGRSGGTTMSGQEVVATDGLVLNVGDLKVSVRNDVSGAWKSGGTVVTDWSVTATVGGPSITFANNIETANAHASATSAIIAAPGFRLPEAFSGIPGRSVVTNTGSISSVTVQDLPPSDTFLVRTFAEDIAMFRWRNGRLTLPEWAESLDRDVSG